MTRTKITFFDMESPGEPANRAFITDGSGDVVLEYVSISGHIHDHGVLSGLSDDDHSQYILVTGTRAFTGTVAGILPTADAHLVTKSYVDDATYFDTSFDHGVMGGLGDDDHSQYALLAGRTGGQILTGGDASGDDLELLSSSDGTKGFVRATEGLFYSGDWTATDGQVELRGGSTDLFGTVWVRAGFNAGSTRAWFGARNNEIMLSMGIAGIEGGDLGIYRDGSSNFGLYADADALEDATGLTVYGRIVVGETQPITIGGDNSVLSTGGTDIFTIAAGGNIIIDPTDTLQISGRTEIYGTLFVDNYTDVTEISEPGNPPTGEYRIYAETDGELYGKNDAGNETLLSLDNLGELENVDLTGETQDDHLAFDGSNWVPSGITAGVVDHGGLTGLSDDDHAQYLLLAGRSTGQTAFGGLDANDDLTLGSTANATKGTIFLEDPTIVGGTDIDPDAMFHVFVSETGATAGSLADDFILEASGHMGMSFLNDPGFNTSLQFFTIDGINAQIRSDPVGGEFQVQALGGNTLHLIGENMELETSVGGLIDVNSAADDADFRVQSSAVVNALFVQGSDGFVGIGTPIAPLYSLHIDENADASRAILLQAGGSTGRTASLLFKTSSNDSDEFIKGAVIFEDDGSSDARGTLHLATNIAASNANVSVADSRLMVDAQGFIGVGTVFPQSLFHASGVGTFNSYLDFQEIAAPATPNANFYRVYPKTDGELYGKNDSGDETLLSLNNLGELENVDLTGEGTNDHLAFDGSNWVPSGVSGGGVSDHGLLTGLADDDHAQYLLLAGRSGGQSAFGGTGAGDHLVLESTDDITRGNVILGNLTSSGRIDNLTDITGSGGIYIRGGSGDVNDDRVVDVLDVQLAANFVLGVSTPTRDQFLRADMDGDGTLTYTDHYLITRAFLGDPKSIKDQILPVGRTGTSAYTITFDTGINVITPDSRLHVVGTQGGLTGGYSADVTADTFHIENKANTGMTISSEDAGSGIITWGFPQDNVYHRLIGTGPSATTSGVVTLWVDNQEIVEWSAGSALQAFQQEATISTTAGNLTLDPNAELHIAANVMEFQGDATIQQTGATSINIIANDILNLRGGTGGVTINSGLADADTRIAGDNEANLFYVDAGTDRIGIHTATPAQPLHIAGVATNTGIEIEGTRPFMFIDHTDTAGFAGGIAFSQSGTTEMEFFYDTGNDELLFWDSIGATHRMVIERTGNIGMGTDAPAVQLHIQGDGGGRLALDNTATSAQRWDFISATNAAHGVPDGTLLVFNDDSSATRLAVAPGGAVGIGTASPAAGVQLDVVGVIKSDVPHDIPGDFTTWWADAPPPSGYVYLGTEDDEFHDSSFDTGIWSEWDVPATMTVTEDEFGMYMTTTTVANGQGIYQPVPPSITNWSFTTFMGPLFGQTGDQKQGIILLEDISAHSTTDAYIWSNFRGGAGYGWQATFLNAYNDFNTDDFNSVSDVRPAGMYLRVRVEGSTWHFDWSEDGYHWVLDRYTRAARFTAEGVGLGGRVSTTTDWRAPYKFARFQNNADDTQMLLGARVKGWYE